VRGIEPLTVSSRGSRSTTELHPPPCRVNDDPRSAKRRTAEAVRVCCCYGPQLSAEAIGGLGWLPFGPGPAADMGSNQLPYPEAASQVFANGYHFAACRVVTSSQELSPPSRGGCPARSGWPQPGRGVANERYITALIVAQQRKKATTIYRLIKGYYM
jgi:hypothetical protein